MVIKMVIINIITIIMYDYNHPEIEDWSTARLLTESQKYSHRRILQAARIVHFCLIHLSNKQKKTRNKTIICFL